MMNTQKAAKWFGIVLVVIGVLAFLPLVVNANGDLFGVIAVNTIFNLIYIIVGMIAFFAADSFKASKNFFKIVGVIFLIIAILGMIGKGTVLHILPNNVGDTILHIIFAFYALYFGFGGQMIASTN